VNYKSQNDGIGKYQAEKAYYAERSIFKALSDGQWHRNMELKETTKLSSRTLDKHLDKMIKLQMIEKKKDVESGKYPVPVFFKATPELTEYIRTTLFVEESRQRIEPALMETKDPLMVLEVIHHGSQLGLIKILTELKNRKNMTYSELYYLEELFMVMPYNFFVHSLLEASRKILDEVDFDQLILRQIKRQKEIAEMLFKQFIEKAQTEKQSP
jgi:hypothetical protein